MSKKSKKTHSKKPIKKLLAVEPALEPATSKETALPNRLNEPADSRPEEIAVTSSKSQSHKIAKLLRTAALIAIFAMAGAAVIYSLPRSSPASSISELTSVHQSYDSTVARVEALQAKQSALGRVAIDDKILQTSLLAIQSDTTSGNYARAHRGISKLNKLLVVWQNILAKPAPTPLPAPILATHEVNPNRIYAPILLYHHPPANMEHQFQHLVDHGYVTVSLQQIADAQNGKGTLPAKPVVITFDDGFADQMPMLELLKKYNLKAVFYIINGGQGSNFHIGANKKANDPEGGDAYLTWDQIRTLDTSGSVEIAAHTTNHLDLARMTPDVQRNEIIGGKHYLEEKLGHIVTNFCFPYGAFNQSAISIVKEAGFTTATTTLPGTDQSVASPFTMRRVRDALTLP